MALAINRLDLAPWGSFTDRTLQFAGGGQVELIDGPNAAGKSTIARAQMALLFGIPGRTVDAHTHPYQDLAIGAELEIDGSSVEVVRRKSIVGSLRGPDGAALLDDPIPTALGGLGRDVYENFFHVDHDTLVRGGEDLLQGKGEVGASLFAAAAGISELHTHLARLDDRAGQIFRPRASSTSMMQELAGLRESDKQLNQTMVRPAAYKRMVQELERQQRLGGELSDQIAALTAEIGDLERLLDVLPLIRRHVQLIVERRDLGDVPDLAPDAKQRRAAAQATLGTERQRRDRHRDEHKRLTTQLNALATDEDLLARAGEIRAVGEIMPVVGKAEADRRRLVGDQRQKIADRDAAAEAAGLPANKLIDLRRPESVRRQLDQVLAEGDRLAERVDLAKGHHQIAATEHEAIADDQVELAKPRDMTALEVGVRAVRPRIGLDDQLTAARQQESRLRAEAVRQLESLSPAPGSTEELLALPSLPEDAVAGLLAAATQQRDDEFELAADRRRLAARRTEHAGLVEELRQLGAVVTPTGLASIRGQRDEHWGTLRESMQRGELVAPNTVVRYEAAIATADEAADTLANDAAGAEKAKRVAINERTIAATADELDERLREIDTAKRELAQGWDDLWAATGLQRINLDRVRDWHRACDAAQAAARAAEEAASEAQTLADQVARTDAVMRGHFAGLIDHVPEAATLAELAELADGLIGCNSRLQKAAAERQGEIDRARKEVRAAKRQLTEAETDHQRWLVDWPQRAQSAGLPPGTDPDRAQELARCIAEGLNAQKEIDQLTTRIAGIDRDRDDFAQRLTALVRGVAVDLEGREDWQAVALLTERLAAQERTSTQRTHLTEQRDGAETDAKAADRACDEAQDVLDRLCRDAGCQAAEDLPVIEQRVDAAVELDRTVAELAIRITETGRETLTVLTKRVDDLDPDEAAVKIEELDGRRDALRQERDELLEQVGRVKQEITNAEEDVEAVTAAEDVEFHQARIADLGRQYALARLSSAVIRRAIERYRDHNQNPLVARANELFGRFTEGSYAELFVDLDDKGCGRLVARSSSRAIHTMEQMSKGTREQLFLALRIAAIERFIELSGPVPVLFDDVFVESDDARCKQIFIALGELATRTQVIVLTHHHHMVPIARDALGSRLHVQELPAVQSGLRAAA